MPTSPLLRELLIAAGRTLVKAGKKAIDSVLEDVQDVADVATDNVREAVRENVRQSRERVRDYRPKPKTDQPIDGAIEEDEERK